MTTKEIAAELRQLDGAMCGAVCHMPNLAKLADRIEAGDKQEATRVWRCEEAGHLWGAEYDRGHCPKCGGRLVPGTFVPISAG